MITLLSGGTGTPKLLSGMAQNSDTVVIGNTGDDVEMGDLLVCPDLDTVMYLSAGVLDQKKWWGIEEDTFDTHERMVRLAKKNGEKSIEIFGDGTPYRQFMHARDLAQIIKMTILKNIFLSFNVATDENYTIKKIVEIALEACNIQNLNIYFDDSKHFSQHNIERKCVVKLMDQFLSKIDNLDNIKVT